MSKLFKQTGFYVVLLFSALLSLNSFAYNEPDDDLPPVSVLKVENLANDAEQSRDESKAILLFFSMTGCSWCQYVEEEHLKPMLRNAGYRKKVIIRKVMTDDFDTVIDFNGNKLTTNELSMRYSASFTPTVVLVDHNGKQLAPRILGVRNTEMYGGDLDDAINLSCRKITGKQVALNP